MPTKQEPNPSPPMMIQQQLNHDDPSKDEDEDDDEDYIPEHDPEVDLDETANDPDNNNGDSIIDRPLSDAKRKVVDDAFDELFGYSFQGSDLKRKQKRMKLNFDEKSSSRKKHVLSQIFGPTAANQMVQNYATDASMNSSIKANKLRKLDSKSLTNEKIQQLVNQVTEEERVTVTKRFAGQEVQITCASQSQSGEVISTNSEKSKKTVALQPITKVAASGVDHVLSSLQDVTKLNTVTKTSADWDQFKSQNGTIAEKLESQAKGKDAYLVKKEFLNRVDGRRFEQEKAEREKERATRDAAGK